MPEAHPSYYDAVFSGGKYERGRESYWKWALQVLVYKQVADKKGIDIGCGPGGFLALAAAAGMRVDGIDFSEEAVRQATPRTKMAVFYGDFWKFGKWEDYEFFVVLETLEHVERDIELVRLLPPGRLVVASVPSWGDPSHVRTFPNLKSVISRYSGLFDDFQATEVQPGLFGFFGILRQGAPFNPSPAPSPSTQE